MGDITGEGGSKTLRGNQCFLIHVLGLPTFVIVVHAHEQGQTVAGFAAIQRANVHCDVIAVVRIVEGSTKIRILQEECGGYICCLIHISYPKTKGKLAGIHVVEELLKVPEEHMQVRFAVLCGRWQSCPGV